MVIEGLHPHGTFLPHFLCDMSVDIKCKLLSLIHILLPMTRDEAILQMNLLEHTFFAFRDEDKDGAFAVVYKRTDGGYGLLEDAD